MADLKGVIFDIDGVLEFQGEVYPKAVEVVKTLMDKDICVRVITNSTLKSRVEAAAKLQTRGFPIEEEHVVTASYATAQYLKTLNPESCWVLQKGKGLEEFAGFHQTDQSSEYIVLGDYRDGFNFENMNKALANLLHGSKLIVMIPEKVDHSLGGVELTVGAYGRMLEDAAEIKATYIGKPNKYVFQMVQQTMQMDRSDILMVGDRVTTDIQGAQNAGMQSALVKTGEFRPKDLDSEITPDYILESVDEVLQLF